MSFPCYRTSSRPRLLLSIPDYLDMARFRSGLHPAQVGPPGWQAIIGPVVAGLVMLLLVTLALSV